MPLLLQTTENDVRRIRLPKLFPTPDAGAASDAALLARFLATQDEAAFELLVRRHAGLVAGVCGRILRDPHLAEDAAQAAFLILARKAGSVRGSNVAGWLFRVSRRVALRARRSAARFGERESPLLDDVAARTDDHPAERAEVLAILDEEIARLPERFRLPVLLCCLGGSTTDDAARMLGCPRGTILSRLAAAREKLAARLARRGFVVPIGVLLADLARPTHLAAFTPSTMNRAAPQLLAQGVLHAMKTTKLLVAAGVVCAAVGLAGGFGLLQIGSGTEPAPVAAAPPAKAEAPRPAPDDASRIAREDEAKRLEELIDRLNSEIQSYEKNAERLVGSEVRTAADLAASLARLEDSIAVTQREIEELEARIAILKKRLADGLAPPTAAELEALVNADPEVSAIMTEVRRLKQTLKFAEGNSNAASIRELKEHIEKYEAFHDKTAAAARAKAQATARKAAETLMKDRIAELEEQLSVKKTMLVRRSVLLDQQAKTLGEVRRKEEMRRKLEAGIEPQREALKRAVLTRLQLQLEARPAPPATTDEKLDAVLKELRELRNEVKQLRERK